MEEEIATIEDKEIEGFIAHLEDRRDQSDHSCRNRNRRREVLLQQIVDGLGVDSLLFSYKANMVLNVHRKRTAY